MITNVAGIACNVNELGNPTITIPASAPNLPYFVEFASSSFLQCLSAGNVY